jgi:cobalt-zinc-cadmium efflux system membrane fusion protein
MRNNPAIACALVGLVACRPTPEPAKAEQKEPGQQEAAHDDAVKKPEEHSDEEEHEAMPTKVRLSLAAFADAKVRVEEARIGQLSPTVDVTGELVADPDHVARVSARIAGRVVEVRFREGDDVRQGAVMAVVESADLARARAAWTSASARAATARVNADRLAVASKDGLVPIQQAASADGEATALEADAVAARQVLSAFGVGAETVPPDEAAMLPVRAPIAGRVVARNAVRGQAVTSEHVLATLVNMDRVFFQARLFEKHLADVQTQLKVDVRLNAYPAEVFPGVVDAIGQQVDPTARTVVARIALQNRNGLLKLGLFGVARVVVDRAPSGPNVLTVPITAVTRIADRDVVFVAHPDGDYEIHPVTLGALAAGRVEILQGLRAGEAVVVDGVFTLKSLVLKNTFGEEE